MINIITEGAVDPSFLTATDVEDMRLAIPVKSAQVDELMTKLAGKMGTDEKVPWENIDDPVQVDAAAGISGISNVESVANSISQQGAPSIWIIKKLLAQTKASPNLKLNGKPLTADVSYTPADFNMYDEATIRAKFSTLPTPAKAMALSATIKTVAADTAEVGSSNVLVGVVFDANTQTWSGVYRQVLAVLQDGTTQAIAFS